MILSLPFGGLARAAWSARIALTATPREGTFDVPVSIRAGGFPPGEPVTVTFRGRAPDGAFWQGSRRVHAGRNGGVELPDEYVFDRMRRRTRGAPGPVTVPRSLPHAVVVSVQASGRTRASTTVRRYSAATLVSSRFEGPGRAGFYGVWYLPRRASGRHAAILLFGGSEGGLVYPYLPATLAARGYPVLDLAYFKEPGLPQGLERIPLEYFRRALEWLAGQPQVDPRRIVTFGASRGGELSLLLGSTFPGLVHGVVANVPSLFAGDGYPNALEPAWTYSGKPVTGEIPVARIDGPVFLTGGGYDAVSASGLAVRMIARRLHQHGHRDVTALVYPKAGHLISLVLPLPPLLTPGFAPGGSVAADDAAREHLWPKLLRFLAALGR